MLTQLDTKPEQFRDRVEATIGRAAQALFAEQKPDGHWVYELEADATIPAEYVLLRHYLGEPVDAELERKIGNYLRRRQSAEHDGWPLYQDGGFDEARAWTLELAGRTAEAMPKQTTIDIRKAKRGGRVYIDVMQNARGHHAVPPYVLRAVPGATVSTPLDWKEVAQGLDPKAFTLTKALARFAHSKTDPFEGLLRSFETRRRKKATRG